MKKILLLFVLITCELVAQTPQYFNSNATGGANSWPFNNFTTARRWQYFCPPGSLGTLGPGNNITKIYFHASGGATITYPILNVKLKTGSGTGLTGTVGGPLESGMTTVFAGTNVQIVAAGNSWFGVTLQTPFLYDPSFPLIVEIEHNATSGPGPTLNQPTTAGSWRRQWADYNTNTITSGDGAFANFGVDVLPATPCTVTPASNTLVPATVSVCPGYAISSPSMASTYSFGGITYQWYASTSSSVGPYTAVSGASMFASPLPTVTVNTWYQVVATCTNPGGGSTTLTPMQVTVAPTTTNTVPYFEGLEGITKSNELPNCSWWSSSTAVCQTYTSSNVNNRVPRTGSKFASFYYLPAGTNYFYTNAILLKAGITYSAAVWYTTEYYGYNNWSDFSIMYGPNQSTTGLVSIVSSNGPAISNIYRSLSNTFSVPSTGMYYVALKATGVSGSAFYLSWDDLSITIPCDQSSPNSPTVSLALASNTICMGESVNIQASGADTYTWNVGGNTASTMVDAPVANMNYQVIATNSLTGCSDTVNQAIFVNPVPSAFIIASKTSVCAGESVNLTVLGSGTHAWSAGTNPSAQMITVVPTAGTVYSVTTTNAFGCSSTASQSIAVKALPTVSASTSAPNQMCVGEKQVLTANGASTFQWISSSSSILMAGTSVTISPNVVTTYTVIGTDVNGCKGTATIIQNVDACVGINEIATSANGYNVHPNPTAGEFTIVSENTNTKVIEVVDVTGKVIVSATSTDKKVKMNIASVATGVYYIKIQSGNSVEVMKIVKQ